jgi:hypothetical protein
MDKNYTMSAGKYALAIVLGLLLAFVYVFGTAH